MTIDQSTKTAEGPPAVLGKTASGLRIAGLAAGFVMSIVDTTVINVAGPEVQHQLGLSLAGLTWVVDGYTLTFAALLLLAGSLANRFGAKTVFLTGVTLFVLASTLCGAAPNGAALVIGRLIQGVGAALSIPSSLGLLANTFPDPKQRAKTVAIWSSISAGSAAVGPLLGGVLVGTIGWRSIFYLNIPIGIVGLLLTTRLINPVPGRRFKPALLGHILSIVGLAGLCFGLIEGGTFGWTSAPIIGSFVVAVVAALFFLRAESRAPEPILPRGLFKIPRVQAINSVSFLLNLGLFGVIFMFGLFIQNARGAEPLEAGLQMLPLWGFFVVGNLTFARITGKAGTRWPMIAGLGSAAVVTLALTTISSAMPYWVLAVLIAISSLSIGVTVPAMTASLVEAVGKEHASTAGSTLNATRQIGTLIGVAIVGAILHGVTDWYVGATVAFLIAGVAYAASALLAWWGTRAEESEPSPETVAAAA
ncbi:DHA2 family efflux MFS transporter permease subunit [Streptomyces decoyicus]|uniref:DHA2 family efflux MFS transporter permease subunit n=1 Tax=Streptomyces decoyicus TaxID=249567 RepID=UPI0033BEEA46